MLFVCFRNSEDIAGRRRLQHDLKGVFKVKIKACDKQSMLQVKTGEMIETEIAGRLCSFMISFSLHQ